MTYIIWKIFVAILIGFFYFSCGGSKYAGQQLHTAKKGDVATWMKLATNSPNMRVSYAMAYDTHHRKIIVHGGRSGFMDFNNINETWAFDYKSKTWKNLKPINSPPWRSSHTMVYDPVRHKLLMFGGNDFKRAFNDLWEYDYDQNSWTELSPANPPESRQLHGMVYIPDRDVVIVFGGRRSNGGAAFADTWEFNCKTRTWTKLNPQNNPPVSDHVNITYDTSERKMILFTSPEIWAYDFDTADWTNLEPANSPVSNHSNLVYDSHNKKTILFGNFRNPNSRQTWSFDYPENKWTNITPKKFPKIDFTRASIIEHAGMVYLSDHDVFIQYGGCCSNQTLELKLNK